MKKFTSVFLAMVLTATVPAGFQTVYAEDTSAEDTQETKTDADNEADADQLLKDLTGSYQELWPVILADDYTQTWIDDCKEIVGEDNAEAAYEKLKSMLPFVCIWFVIRNLIHGLSQGDVTLAAGSSHYTTQSS